MSKAIKEIEPQKSGQINNLRYEREEILNLLHEAIITLHQKAVSGRIRDVDKDKVRMMVYRTMAYTSNVYNSLLKDKELSELQEDVEKLKAQFNVK